MSAITIPTQNNARDLPPPPYPPPLPIEELKYNFTQDTPTSSSNSLAQPTSDLVVTVSPVPKSKRYTQKVKDFSTHAQSLAYTVYTDAARATTEWFRTHAPAAKSAIESGKAFVQKRFKNSTDYMQEESPIYSAFIALGASVLLFSLVLIPFVNPAVWIIIAIAALIQLGVGYILKTKL